MKHKQVNILLVDDRQENILAMKSVLDSPDYRIMAAYSGEETLRWLLKEDFALIMLDVQMPGLNGFDTAKLIKSREKSKHIPIIFVTALSQAPENVLNGYEVGAIDFIFKPVNPDALRYKVEAFVGMYRFREQVIEQNELISRRTCELEEMNRKLTETAEELSKAESLARIIGETSADTILTIDAQGTIIAANPAIETMFGRTPADTVGLTMDLLLPGYGIGTTVPQLDGTKEYTAVSTTGEPFPVEVQWGLSQHSQQPLSICSVRDITVRKQLESEREQQLVKLEQLVGERTDDLRRANRKLMEQMEEMKRMASELRDSHDRMYHILESITDSFYAVDKEWRLLYMNDSAKRIFGITRDVIGMDMWELFTEAHHLSRQLLPRAMQEKAVVCYEVYSEVAHTWLEIRGYPTEQGMSVYFSDTTERRRLQEDIVRTKEQFYSIFKSSPSLISIRSLRDGRYLDMNRSWFTHTGYTGSDMMSKDVDLQIRAIDPEEDYLSLADWSGEPLNNVKITYITKTGQSRTGLLSTEKIEFHSEACELTVITDITERAELEREIARLDRLHLIGEMAAGIAHEIRNPMTTVRGFLQMAKSGEYQPSPDIIDLMVDELGRANLIITEFLTLAKNKTTHFVKYSLNTIVEALFPLIQAEATLAGKDVELALDHQCPEVDVDEKEIRQMILNLALNGLEAMTVGGTLSIRTYCGIDAGSVMLEVEDQGSGIPKDVLEKLGTPFFTTKDKGTGLGLAVCYSIASRHQTKLDVRTGESGTVFSVRFGRRAEHAEPAGAHR